MRVRARGGDQLSEVAHIRRRADERERDEVDAEFEREVEVVHVLPGYRRNRHRHARHIHAFVGLDDAAGQDDAASAAALDRLDPQPDEPVVDEDVVTSLKDLAHRRGRDRELTVARSFLGGDHDLVTGVERDRAGKLADAHLGALQIGDDRDRAPDLRRELAHEPDPLRMLLVRPVREVQARRVHPRLGDCEEGLPVGRSRTDRCDDLRPARRLGGHALQRSCGLGQRCAELRSSSTSWRRRRPSPG